MSKKLHIHYLPVGLTTFQKDLVEILISLHSKSFREEMGIKIEDGVDNSENITIKSEDVRSKISHAQLVYLFDNNIRAVLNHPCLLVDHYMPRQFLLMEPNERLISSSDKFQKLDHIISSLINRDRTKFPNPLKISLISHNVRELDLLEGFLLGKRLKIKRVSGTSLFDEKHIYPTEKNKIDSSNDSSESKSITPLAESSSNKYTGYSRDDYDYSVKRMKKYNKANDDDWLFLTTSTHLLNDPTLLSEYNIELIISFDPLLDPKLEALENIRLKSNGKLALIKMIVKDSPDHYILENKIKFEKDNEYEHMKESINHFLKTRDTSIGEVTKLDYNGLIEGLLSGTLPSNSLSDIRLTYETQGNIHPYLPILSPLEYSETQLSSDNEIIDIKTYQMELMKRTVCRMKDIQNDYREKCKIILDKRVIETDRQNKFDDIKNEIGVSFKKFQDIEKSLNDSEKRLERSTTETIKLRERLNLLKEDEIEIAELLTITDNGKIQEYLNKFEQEIKINQEKLDSIKTENAEKYESNEGLRLEYQKNSSNAADLGSILKNQKEQMDKMKKIIDGPTASLEYDSVLVEGGKEIAKLKSLQDKCKFISNYINKMNSHYDLKISNTNGGNGNGSSNGNGSGAGGNMNTNQGHRSPSNPSNKERSMAKNSRYRSTRSNSPAYTY
ncbi:hypothetical protein Kpol_1004p71 [Vanderwaltozyma polyspora DSM 70294]|uniref:HDA1 complex subunit 2 n=1 Tax=Vanderwaltozyma polyspora (strain ATCC 22028 / DSM 70294 / BCRC 21397 / CBS 2163 / NBRC 10782 / NRRL Y-8283 / UCD 57-17) TaxID=436907 RepID=A7TJC4_VANPO|nr:uncharacterized protein Kpol_1004p71 [Vanderwaltozyma polyspora DSM 70294]EDO17693.1 hypothetical protein Kpol_1004p71 [Vanderwaltozyma polyspora DSM 70294]